MSEWRKVSRDIISKCIIENADKSDKELKKIISKKYPFGQRRYHPYKIWLNEIKRQINGYIRMKYKKHIDQLKFEGL